LPYPPKPRKKAVCGNLANDFAGRGSRYFAAWLQDTEALQGGLSIGGSVAQARAANWHFAPMKNSVVAALVGLPRAGMLLSDAPPRPMRACQG